MPNYLDVANWARRDTFEFFQSFDKPYFNICASVDATNLLALLRDRPDLSVSLAHHYFALRIANEIEPFRYRLRDGRVLVHDVIHGGTTVLLPNESFIMAYFDHEEDFEKFMVNAMHAIDEARSTGTFSPNTKGRPDSLHGSAVGVVYQLFARPKLGTRGFCAQDLRRRTTAHCCRFLLKCITRWWTARGAILCAFGRSAAESRGMLAIELLITMGTHFD